MFFQEFKYNFIITLRQKSIIWWTMLFVILLGTLFRVAFSNAYESMELFAEIPVAACIEDEAIRESFDGMVTELTVADGDKKLLSLVETKDRAEAEQLLSEKEIRGIFYSEDGLLKVMVNGDDIKEGILVNIATSYHQILTVLNAVGEKTQSEQAVLLALGIVSGERTNNQEISLVKEKLDPFTSYFYNLMAMGMLFASFAGLLIVVNNQANLSSLGARKNVAGVYSMKKVVAALLSNLLLLTVCEFLAMSYLALIGVKWGTKYLQMGLIVMVGVWTGLCLGYFVGSFGKLSADAKQGICVGVSMLLCFLSGLMFANIKPMIQERAPWFNKINPAALISDSFYALAVYDEGMTYWYNILTLLAMSFVMLAVGCAVGRRKRYASI